MQDAGEEQALGCDKVVSDYSNNSGLTLDLPEVVSHEQESRRYQFVP